MPDIQIKHCDGPTDQRSKLQSRVLATKNCCPPEMIQAFHQEATDKAQFDPGTKLVRQSRPSSPTLQSRPQCLHSLDVTLVPPLFSHDLRASNLQSQPLSFLSLLTTLALLSLDATLVPPLFSHDLSASSLQSQPQCFLFLVTTLVLPLFSHNLSASSLQSRPQCLHSLVATLAQCLLSIVTTLVLPLLFSDLSASTLQSRCPPPPQKVVIVTRLCIHADWFIEGQQVPQGNNDAS